MHHYDPHHVQTPAAPPAGAISSSEAELRLSKLEATLLEGVQGADAIGALRSLRGGEGGGAGGPGRQGPWVPQENEEVLVLKMGGVVGQVVRTSGATHASSLCSGACFGWVGERGGCQGQVVEARVSRWD